MNSMPREALLPLAASLHLMPLHPINDSMVIWLLVMSAVLALVFMMVCAVIGWIDE